MFSSEQYRAKAAEYLKLAANTESPNEIREFGDLERSYTVLANNEEWLEHNFHKMVHAPDKDRLEGDALAAEEEHILHCHGAAVIMQWNNIPKKLQRELFDKAGSMGDLLSTKALRGKVARFLHKHKDDELRMNEGQSPIRLTIAGIGESDAEAKLRVDALQNGSTPMVFALI